MKKTINIAGKLVCLDKPLIMGIINVTPDSFYKDSRYSAFEEGFLQKASEMIKNGADIIDIGGYSSRPNADNVSIEEELSRVIPAIKILKNEFTDLPISIDTFRSEVARKAVEAGANMINDISGGSLDENMFETVASLNVPYILMHMRGNPKNMQSLSCYEDLIKEISFELMLKANQLKALGVKDIILDPGFGFSKTLEQNYELLKSLNLFTEFEYPILVGLSRKSMIYKYLNIEVEDALNATNQLNLFALLEGANILRVHDVFEASQSKKLYKMLK